MAGPKVRRWIGAFLGVVGGFAIIGCWLGDLVNAGPLLPPPIESPEPEGKATPWSAVKTAEHTAPIVPPMIPLPKPKAEEPADVPLPPPPTQPTPEVKPEAKLPAPPPMLPQPIELPKPQPSTPEVKLPPVVKPEPQPTPIPVMPDVQLPFKAPTPDVPPAPKPEVKPVPIPELVMPNLTPAPTPKETPIPETIDVAPMPRKSVKPEPPAQPEKTPSDLSLPKSPSEFNVNPMPPASPSVLLPSPRSVDGLAESHTASVSPPKNSRPKEIVMTFPNRELTLSTLLGVALATSPVQAIAQEQPKEVAVAPDPGMKDDIKAIQANVKQLQEFHKEFTDVLYGKADGIGGANPGVVKLLTDMDQRLKAIENRLTAMESTMKQTQKTESAFTPDEKKPTPVEKPEEPKIEGSAVKVQNDYPVEISIVINDVAYRVGPGKSKVVDVPSGSYKYEILAAGSEPITKVIGEGEMVTLHIH